MVIEQINIDSLVFAEYNPRQLTEDEYQQLKDSIERFGLVDPILVNDNKDRKNVIIGGHQRIRVAKKLGIKEVPCVFFDLDIHREKELNIRLNKNTGSWDYDILADLFDLDDLIGWGFKEDQLVGFSAEDEFHGKINEDEIPETIEPICKKGQVWKLGDHRIICGDATNKKDVERLMDGEKAELLHADPPYGMGKENLGVLNDNLYNEKLDFANLFLTL